MAFIRGNLPKSQNYVLFRNTVITSVNGPQLTISLNKFHNPLPAAVEDIAFELYNSGGGAGLPFVAFSASLATPYLYVSVYQGSALFAADSNSVVVVARWIIGSR